MADPVEAFIEGVRSVEPFSTGSSRRVAIRQKITEFENALRREQAGARATATFLHRARQRASREVSRHKRNDVLTRTAEFFQEVFEELSVRMRLAIKERDDDTFRIEVEIGPAGAAPHVVRSGFYSLEDARLWIDSEQGDTLIKAVIEKFAE